MSGNIYKVNDIFGSLNSAVALSAILKHHGKLSVPLEEFDSLLNKVQLWPNDYLTLNDGEGHMSISYNHEKNTIDFELGRSQDGIDRGNPAGYTCMRNIAEFGYVNHDSPRYKH
ncbi:hypothetical protein EB001_16220 [bacterium]|jgi:hypothetical protein|nr:hypothetical protein [bacterium]